MSECPAVQLCLMCVFSSWPPSRFELLFHNKSVTIPFHYSKLKIGIFRHAFSSCDGHSEARDYQSHSGVRGEESQFYVPEKDSEVQGRDLGSQNGWMVKGKVYTIQLSNWSHAGRKLSLGSPPTTFSHQQPPLPP